MKIAVIGAGIFGSTVAIKLSDKGFKVDLFEKEPDILQAASGINQYRLHRGYHYPRSTKTALSSKLAEASFRKEYGDAVLDHNEHYYVLAKDKSLVSGKDFLSFCRDCELEHEKVELDHVHPHMVELVIRGRESVIDPLKLKGIVYERITKNKINLLLNQAFEPEEVENYEFVVNCTYASLNLLLRDLPTAMRQYQFELCEKPVLKLPGRFNKKSIVVLDGPFFCIDPYSNTDYHVMGNVVHAIHATNTGLYPEILKEFKPLMNRGIIKNPSITNITKFIDTASEFMPDIKDAEHIGSMYTIRTVLPNVESTDERPTLVSRINDKIINVFSGKIGNCVQAADEVLELVKPSIKLRDSLKYSVNF